MAYAPHHNGELFNGNGVQVRPRLVASFRHAETGAHFETADRTGFPFGEEFAAPAEFPHIIYVGVGETRFARVLKTVAYVVTDEDADGTPVVEKWAIKNRRVYPA